LAAWVEAEEFVCPAAEKAKTVKAVTAIAA
jgi:hypothetical protein